MSVKEDGISLFGFENQDELGIFKLLITVSGIGPKGALGILSSLSPNELLSAVALADVKTLSKAPGIGKKTAERLVLELKDKFSKIHKETSNLYEATEAYLPLSSVKDEAAEALLSLGYTQKEAYAAINAVYFDGLNAEAIIKRALSALNRL
ncbi:Holliday junction ATP-dependent DNA helicase RuvA [bioreactor metagenome]|uniref:Holliday junction ATP-dependent DNA helicase RuvA n=1 Tax=bioreactor metagenome TaxID=1076179 RepID=A0A645FDQ9_9ZZZZ